MGRSFVDPGPPPTLEEREKRLYVESMPGAVPLVGISQVLAISAGPSHSVVSGIGPSGEGVTFTFGHFEKLYLRNHPQKAFITFGGSGDPTQEQLYKMSRPCQIPTQLKMGSVSAGLGRSIFCTAGDGLSHPKLFASTYFKFNLSCLFSAPSLPLPQLPM